VTATAPAETLFSEPIGESCPLIPVTRSAFEAWRGSAAAQRRWAESAGFTADKGAVLALPEESGGLAGALLGLGAGEEGESGPDPWLWASAAEKLPSGDYRLPEDVDGDTAMQAALGWALAQYRFDRYRTEGERHAPRRLAIVDADACARAQAAVEAVCLVRDLVNTPAGDMTPAALQEAAENLAAAHGAECRSIQGEALLEENFPAIHAVGRAAAVPPRLVELAWGDETAPALTLVGKGVCFDSGGLNLKGATGMRNMKKDMGGAAHVLGLAKLVMGAGLPVRLRVLIPAVENAVSGNAFRPGDILATRKGLSVEIANTDAEGRLILADALAYADEAKPDLILDFATLTGAARVALGPDVPALFTPDHALADALARAASRTGDPLWRLPLWQPYIDDLSSGPADIANASEGGFAGAITAALFLSRFVEAAPHWAHLDIFAWNQKSRPGRPAGGEAMALRAVFEALNERYGAAS